MVSEKYLAKIYRFILDCENETASCTTLPSEQEAERRNQPGTSQERSLVEYIKKSTTRHNEF